MDSETAQDQVLLQRAMAISLAVGILMLFIKVGAYLLTGSIAILSDAAESVVHVVAVVFAAYSLRLSYKPADKIHPYGYAKTSFFSAGFEGSMILLAALFIFYTAVDKWMTGLALERLGLGTGLTALAMVINGVLGGYLLWLGKKKKSLILEANGHHVLTDCWTSTGVLVGLGLTLATGWLPFDPIFAIVAGLNILYSGTSLIRRSIDGLMDRADPVIRAQLEAILVAECDKHNIQYHGLRHRDVGDVHWVEVHLLFAGDSPIRSAHRTATAVEQAIMSQFQPKVHVTTHLEAIEDHPQVHGSTSHML